jgi:hypothetical protein
MPRPSATSAIEKYKQKVLKSLKHLAYSYHKVQSLSSDVSTMDDETLEVWESFTARFSRTVDLFLTKYVRAVVLRDDPGFSGSVRDFADYAEKLELIASADQWMEFRGFRNIIVHDYEESELQQNLEDLRRLASVVLAVEAQLK